MPSLKVIQDLPEQLIPIKEAAQRMGVHKDTVWNRIRSGQLRSWKPSSKRLVDAAEVNELIANSEQ